MEQMTIWEFLNPPSIEEIPEEEMVNIISSAVGLDFEYKDDLRGWVYENKKNEFTLSYSTFKVEPYTRFISVGWCRKYGDYYGCGRPCTSIEEAIEAVNAGKEFLLAGKEKT